MGLDEQLLVVAGTAARFAEEGEEVAGVVPAEPDPGRRVYLCAYRRGEERSWLALDSTGAPISERGVVREAVSIAALCELAEESAGGGDVAALRARLLELRLTENPEGIEQAEAAAAELEEAILPPPRVASVGYLDALGAASRRLERALGDTGESPFAAAMKVGAGAAEELADQVVRGYKRPLA